MDKWEELRKLVIKKDDEASERMGDFCAQGRTGPMFIQQACAMSYHTIRCAMAELDEKEEKERSQANTGAM